jgi:hypothetical protein
MQEQEYAYPDERHDDGERRQAAGDIGDHPRGPVG